MGSTDAGEIIDKHGRRFVDAINQKKRHQQQAVGDEMAGILEDRDRIKTKVIITYSKFKRC